MNQEDLREIIYLLTDKDISELAIERGNESLRIKRTVRGFANGGFSGTIFSPVLASAETNLSALSTQSAGGSVAATAAAIMEEELHLLKSSTVGIFRDSKPAGGPAPIQLGDVVEKGQVVGFIEVLRLLSDVPADVTGEVVKKLVNHGQPVEYGQALFALRPRKK